jgi:hypothetical protein
MSISRAPYDPRRRRVLRMLSLAGLTSLGAPALSMAQSRPDTSRAAGATPAAPPAAPGGAPAAGEKPPEISEDAKTLAELVKRRYGQHLTTEQLESVTKEIDGRLQGGAALRKAKLANGEEPDFTFHA